MKKVTLVLMTLLLFSCSQHKTNIIPQNKSSVTNEIVKMTGKITQEKYINKANKTFDFYDYYFNTENEKYFIKIISSQVTETEIKENLNQKITIKASIEDGLWDTNDAKVQRRTGKHITIESLN